VAEADRSLLRGRWTPTELARGNRLQFATFEVSKLDSRVRAGVAAWSSCMGRSGYWYADPLAAAADPGFADGLSRAEIDVALADIRCKARTNLIGIWFAVEAAYQRRAIEADPEGFAATRAAIAARDAVATAIVAGEHGTGDRGPGGQLSVSVRTRTRWASPSPRRIRSAPVRAPVLARTRRRCVSTVPTAMPRQRAIWA
jgi:hypothetical protein